MRAGLLGGTFDPPHLGHLVLAAAARHALRLDRVLLVPAGDPYRKASRQVSTPAARLRMVEAAIAHLPWAEVSTLELERSGPSYTTETLETLAGAGGEWWFIAGQDVLEDLPNWYQPERLVRAARLAVARRPSAFEGVPPATLAAVPDIEERIDAVPMPALAVSSTELRRRVRAGDPTDVWLPQAVREVVDALALYRD